MKLTKEHFRQVYLDYYSALCFFARGIVRDRKDAEDIVEDVFIKLLQSERVFTEEDNLRAYLYAAIRNASLTYLSKINRAKTREGKYQAALPESEPAFINDIIKTEVVRSIIQAIKKLPGQESKVIEMSYIQGLKNAQIAELLGLSEQTVKNLKSKGLAVLRNKLSPSLFMLLLLLRA